MPMKHTHLVVHHRVDSFVDEMDGKEVSCSVYHDSPIRKLGFVLNYDG